MSRDKILFKPQAALASLFPEEKINWVVERGKEEIYASEKGKGGPRERNQTSVFGLGEEWFSMRDEMSWRMKSKSGGDEHWDQEKID